jgi:hypothetical protein
MTRNRWFVSATLALLLGTVSIGCSKKEDNPATSTGTNTSAQTAQQSVQQNPAIPPEAKAHISEMEQRERASSAAGVPAALKNQPTK